MAFGWLRLACFQYSVSIGNFTTHVSSNLIHSIVNYSVLAMYQFLLLVEKVIIEAAVP